MTSIIASEKPEVVVQQDEIELFWAVANTRRSELVWHSTGTCQKDNLAYYIATRLDHDPDIGETMRYNKNGSIVIGVHRIASHKSGVLVLTEEYLRKLFRREPNLRTRDRLTGILLKLGMMR